MSLEFYRDEAGDPRARAGRDREALAHFLESDVQGSAAFGLEILAAIEAVTEGRLPNGRARAIPTRWSSPRKGPRSSPTSTKRARRASCRSTICAKR